MNHVLKSHATSPRHMGVLRAPNGYSRTLGPCGDSMELFLTITDETVERASFVSRGCAHTIACGSMLTEMIQGLPLGAAADVRAEQIEKGLGGLPRDHRHCAALAALTLRRALRNHFQRRQPS